MKVIVGDRVKHKRYGKATIFELTEIANFADINLDKDYISKHGRIRNSAIVLITDLKIIENDIR